MLDQQFPDILYKYRSLESFEQITNLLSKGEIFFSSAKSFNDPFDTAITYNVDDFDSPIAEKWMNVATDRHLPDASRYEKDEYIRKRLIEIRQPGDAETFKEELIEKQYTMFGLCSLAATNDDLLMWAHYSSRHTGICVGLSVPTIVKFTNQLLTKRILIDLIQIVYSGVIPKVNFYQTMIDFDSHAEFDELVRTKSSHWSYEQEYRLVYWDKSNISVEFGPQVITQLILGCRIQPEHKEQILQLSRAHLPHARLFQAKKNSKHFALDLIPIP